ncbi:Dolichyl-phosphate beta-D-mannosyltransferase [Rhodomicrobium vannielii ATCC 17100]|uniref:Dolichyl-phosphate beta-D-mannosyltransferase n=1 Tax=Rhodomicrobium vannielii (strain ATCC 17100 / DSM 162 / LMG 4299 / NCIMB 10020 / ATH 3.1.1) TaxID=648757 RepID=E3I810_RHOVT|nr:glycosyltransferase family 2 protein [Rhodomicrobium vannielii]ADP71936.1 Dolichyl-phosphate beta-D-mannosyltransferase [Rhodomicrobium vannielii ATCC 17100]
MQPDVTEARRIEAAPAIAKGPDLTVIAPTFNERENVEPLIAKLAAALDGVHWEVIFVDDDSHDGTAARVREVARRDSRVRCVQRLGRRGLTSACAEAVLASSASYVAIIDADLQHDETLLPRMLELLRREPETDVVIGSRYTEKSLSEGFTRVRQAMSYIATRLAQTILRAKLSDPVSGFFMAKREVFEGSIRSLSGIGNKILVDVFASSPRPLKFKELAYQFKARLHGESKLDTLTVWEYLVLLADKSLGRIVPVRFLLFSLVGFSGVLVHLGVLRAALVATPLSFATSQALATLVAAVSNFFLNNWLTYRDKRLTGWQVIPGLITFLLACSVGAVVNVAFAETVFELTELWWLAGIAGAAVSAVLNYATTSIFTWRKR